MNLKFPELRGGTFQGLNDAGVENFQGAIDVYVSRECGQNTGDAPGAGVKTVRLVFERTMMRASDIPAFPQLRETLGACLERWKDKEKEKEFFEQAVNLASFPAHELIEAGANFTFEDFLSLKRFLSVSEPEAPRD